MLVLGLNCCFGTVDSEIVPDLPRWFYHDAAACLVRDGTILAAVEEERLSRIKHTNHFAAQAIRYCLDAGGCRLSDVDRLAFFYTEEHTDTELALQFIAHPSAPVRRSRQLIIDRLRSAFGEEYPADRIVFVPHHVAHGASTFFHSGFEDALVVVLDGNGEEESISVYSGTPDGLRLERAYPIGVSLGHLYSTTTQLLGYRLFDEYKVMGLAPYGDPSVFGPVFSEVYRLRPDGEFDLDVAGLQRRFVAAGYSPRRAGERFGEQHAHLAAALQATLETIALHVLGHWRERTGHRRLCLAGGVAHNCSMNGRIARARLFDSVFVDPASHDAGAAVGAAYAVVHGKGAFVAPKPRLRHVFLGPRADEAGEVTELLNRWDDLVTVERCADICGRTAELLSAGAVVGWVQGRSEFGPRALGNRSILADPRPAENRSRINDVVKRREAFRPFAPAVLAEDAERYFEIPSSAPSLDFMSFALPVRAAWRETLGAVVHTDGTARVQVVHRDANPTFWELIKRFGALTGVPVVLNTSFNNNAEPIVQSAEDALVCFLTTRLDHLVIGDLLIGRRPADARVWLGLTIRLAPTARASRTVADLRSRVTEYAVRQSYTEGPHRAISAEAYAVLSLADGVRPLSELCAQAGIPTDPAPAVVDELIALWEERYVRLAPAPPTRTRAGT
jgi:predicted NodU family carbamoyl transferase